MAVRKGKQPPADSHDLIRSVKPGLFSANSEGACPNCNGAGIVYTDRGDDGRRRRHLRGVRGEALPGRRARVRAEAHTPAAHKVLTGEHLAEYVGA